MRHGTMVLTAIGQSLWRRTKLWHKRLKLRGHADAQGHSQRKMWLRVTPVVFSITPDEFACLQVEFCSLQDEFWFLLFVFNCLQNEFERLPFVF
jgi:hypothetical protein